MIATCTFSVTGTQPVPFESGITAALPVGIMRMEKALERHDPDGASGRCVTQFNYGFDPETGSGTYVALESFEGELGSRRGCFLFLHSASTTGSDRTDEIGRIIPGSGTDDLAGITGDVALTIDADGTHRFEFDYQVP